MSRVLEDGLGRGGTKDEGPRRGGCSREVPLRRRRVLVADDNRDAGDSLAMLLELAGHEVRVAHRGRVALSIAQAFLPDAMLCDISMPDLTG